MISNRRFHPCEDSLEENWPRYPKQNLVKVLMTARNQHGYFGKGFSSSDPFCCQGKAKILCHFPQKAAQNLWKQWVIWKMHQAQAPHYVRKAIEAH